jgi:hypothetical protein
MNNKGSLTLGFVVIILALIILGSFLIDVASRECNKNADCSADSYCNSENECHKFPDKVLVGQNNFVPASLIFGISIIIAALIFRKK